MPEPTAPRIEDTLVRGYRQLALETPARSRDVLLRSLDVALSGLFTFGEIGPTPRGDLAYYNHTAILVLLREVGA